MGVIITEVSVYPGIGFDYKLFFNNLDSKELDSWIISTYLILINDNKFFKNFVHGHIILILIQIKWLDGIISWYDNKNEWKNLRSLMLEKMGKLSVNQTLINLNYAKKFIKILNEIRLKIEANKSLNLIELIEENLKEITLKIISVNNENIDQKFICKLNDETIKELRENYEDFDLKISSII